MSVGKSIGKFFAFVFTIFFALFSFLILYVVMIKNITTYEHISDYVSSTNVFDCSSEDTASSKGGGTLRNTIEKELFEFDVPKLVTDEILDSSEMHKIMTDYIYYYSDYLINNGNKPKFPRDDFIKIIEDKYYSSQNKGFSDEQRVKITAYVNTLAEKVDNAIVDNAEINELINIDSLRTVLTFMNSPYILFILSAILVVLLIAMCICLGNIVRGIRWAAKAVLVDGIVLIIASILEVRLLIMNINSKGIIDNLLISAVDHEVSNLLVYGVVFIILGVICLIMTGVVLRIQSKKTSKQILDNVISDEVENSGGVIKTEQINTSDAEISNSIEDDNNELEVKDEEVSNGDIAEGIVAEDISSEEDEKESVDIPIEKEDNETDIDNIPNEVSFDSESEVQVDEPVDDKEFDQSDDSSNDIEINSFDDVDSMQIVDVSEEIVDEDIDSEPSEMEIAIETPISDDVANEETSDETSDYEEISDVKHEIVKEDIKAIIPSTVDLDITYPVKANDIEESNTSDDDDIEIL